LRRTFVGDFDLVPAALAIILVPAVVVTLVDLPILACVQIAFVGTADYSLLSGSGLVANDRALVASGRLGAE
jgi:hypothetical protein